MGLFDFLNKKEVKLTDEQKKWNKMWDIWADGKSEPPYKELMTYQSEVNNGGHDQYFTNTENIGDIQKEISVLKTVLPPKLRDNLEKAYRAYLLSEENDDENAVEIMDECDDVFYKYEVEINRLLEEYAPKIEL